MWSPGARRGRADAKLGWTGAATCLVCCATGQCGGGSGERRGSGSVDTAEVAADRTQRWWAEWSPILDVIYPVLLGQLFSVFTWSRPENG